MLSDIRVITSSNEREVLSLSIAKDQRRFIESISQCLQEAREDTRYVPVGLYKNETAVGFAMYGKFEDQVWLDRFLIDERFQGKGLGKCFIGKLISFLENEYPGHDLYLSVYENNTHAIQLYKQFGFTFTGDYYKPREKIMKKVCEFN
ncbi:Spermine/spermidine acetyltransferase [compost metagenome]